MHPAKPTRPSSAVMNSHKAAGTGTADGAPGEAQISRATRSKDGCLTLGSTYKAVQLMRTTSDDLFGCIAFDGHLWPPVSILFTLNANCKHRVVLRGQVTGRILIY